MLKKTRPRTLHRDKRGKIARLVEGTFVSALLITSKKGSVRANHYHKKDSHYTYLLKGRMRYTFFPIGSPKKKRTMMVRGGDLLFTPAREAHAMEFLEDSVFVALTAKGRSRKAYEADTVRLQVVQP